MARPLKKGFDYFSLDVGFFSDRPIKILRSRYGADGMVIYLYLLCEIYKEGFFIRYDDDFQFIIADDLNMSVDKIGQVISFLAERSLFDSKLFRTDVVLTSEGIQRRWQLMMKERACKTPPVMEAKYWLLSRADTADYLYIPLGFSENNIDNSENNTDNSEKNETKKRRGKEKQSISDVHSAREEAKLKFMGGTLGKGVVLLSPDQIEALLDYCSIEEFNKYVEIVADMELQGKHYKKSHYRAIMDMVEKDRKIGGAAG